MAKKAARSIVGQKKQLEIGAAAHITHEAVEQLGGIGTVLQGLIASSEYQKAIKRSILVAPLFGHMPTQLELRLGEGAEVLYSSPDNHDACGLSNLLKPIEYAFNVDLVYGKRTFVDGLEGESGEAEILLVDINRISEERMNHFKGRLFETFGLDCQWLETNWDFEEYARLAEPAFYALRAILNNSDLPCVMFGHEYMGMPSLLKAIMDGGEEFKTVYYAHECSTARAIVENHPGHDLRFYGVLNQLKRKRRQSKTAAVSVESLFDIPESAGARHSLVRLSHHCDAVFAVGEHTADEMRFLSHEKRRDNVMTVHNGVSDIRCNSQTRTVARELLREYAYELTQDVLADKPDFVFTHVTRPVISKCIWRDLSICAHLDRILAVREERAVFFLLTSAAGIRSQDAVMAMESDFGWPRHHRMSWEGYHDLSSLEVDLWSMINTFNQDHANVQIILVNQFGWGPDRLGQRYQQVFDQQMQKKTHAKILKPYAQQPNHMALLRMGTDLEWGLSCYEPFGISPLEPMGCGAICVVSSVSGCAGLVSQVAEDGQAEPNVIIADYVRALMRKELQGKEFTVAVETAKNIGFEARDEIEKRVHERLAKLIDQSLPRSAISSESLRKRGQKMLSQMNWNHLVDTQFRPALKKVMK